MASGKIKLLVFSVASLFLVLSALGFDPFAPAYVPYYPSAVTGACVYLKLPSLTLLNQWGQAVRFPPNGTFVLSFGYTYCPDVCPLTFAILKRLQDRWNVAIYVVTVDPERDTPERLRAFAEGMGYNWTFLTGDVSPIWRALGLYVGKARVSGGYLIYHDVVFALVVNGTVKAVVRGLAEPETLINYFAECSPGEVKR